MNISNSLMWDLLGSTAGYRKRQLEMSSHNLLINSPYQNRLYAQTADFPHISSHPALCSFPPNITLGLYRWKCPLPERGTAHSQFAGDPPLSGRP